MRNLKRGGGYFIAGAIILLVFINPLAGCSPPSYYQTATTSVSSLPAGEQKRDYGTLSDTKEPVSLYTITNNRMAQVELIDYGATIRSLRIPTNKKNDGLIDVVLGYDSLSSYEKNSPYLGSSVGRVCNRIKDGKFALDGQVYQLATNNAPNHLHGGDKGFSHRLWKAKEVGPEFVTFEYVSPDGEEGYPSAVRATATFRLLSDPNRLMIEYKAKNEGNKTTPINLTNHAYFNLCGVDKPDANIRGHELAVYSDAYLETDSNAMVTGQIVPVDGTPFDLRRPALLGDRLDQLKPKLGYDHHFTSDVSSSPKKLAVLSCPDTGLSMTVSSTQPGLQVYTAQHMNETGGKYGRSYGIYAGIALETQHYPDSVNHPEFPPVWLRAGENYKEVTILELYSS